MILRFEENSRLILQGEKYKRRRYPDADEKLRDWLERKTFCFVFAEELSPDFYERELLDQMLAAFDSVLEIYFFLKDALRQREPVSFF